MNRLALVALVALAAGCGIRETRTKTIEIDGERFLCSYTHNNLSGNESEQVCVPIPDDTTTTEGTTP